MPYFGPGVDQHVNLAATPTWVFTPTPGSAPSTIRVVNEGSNIVWLGTAAVAPGNGLPLYPNTRVELPSAGQSLYACSSYQASTVTSSTVTTASTAGASSMTVGTLPAIGATVTIGNQTFKEVVTVAGTAGSVFTASTTFLYDHAVGSTVSTVLTTIGQIRVNAGVL